MSQKKNQTKFLGSHNTIHTGDIIHNHTIQDDINLLSETGDVKKAMKLMDDIKSSVSRAHPVAPFYRYKPIEYNGKTILTHEPTSNEAASKFPLIHKGTFAVNSKELHGIKNYSELQSRILYGGERISIKPIKIQSYIGEKEVTDEFTNYFFNKSNNIFLESAQKVRSEPFKLVTIDEKSENEKIIIEYIELQVNELYEYENKIHLSLSNKNQFEFPFEIKLKLLLEKDSNGNRINQLEGTMNVELKKAQSRYFKTYQMLYSMLDEIHNKFITFRHHKSKLEFPCGIISSKNIYGKDEQSVLFEKEITHRALKIEEKFNVSFKTPEKITQKDLDNLYIIELAIKNEGYISKMIDPIVANAHSKKGLEELFDDFKQGEPVGKVKDESIYEISLFGVTFKNILRTIEFPPLMLKNSELIKKKKDLMSEGDSIKFELIPINKKELKVSFRIIN